MLENGAGAKAQNGRTLSVGFAQANLLSSAPHYKLPCSDRKVQTKGCTAAEDVQLGTQKEKSSRLKARCKMPRLCEVPMVSLEGCA